MDKIFISVDSTHTQIGTADFVHAFFSNISYHLEQDGWGTRFPVCMNILYQGTLDKELADSAIEELGVIKEELAQVSVQKLIWDIEDIAKALPNEEQVSQGMQNITQYFSEGKWGDIFAALKENLEYLRDLSEDEKIRFETEKEVLYFQG